MATLPETAQVSLPGDTRVLVERALDGSGRSRLSGVSHAAYDQSTESGRASWFSPKEATLSPK